MMSEDLILAFYLLIMIVQRRWFFANANAESKHWSLWPIFTWIRPRTGIYHWRTVFYFVPFYAL